jgi:two-component system response regulator PrrA
MAAVFVIDDDLALVKLLDLILRIEGFEVHPFPSPLDALAEVAGGANPDAIVLDLNMPEMEGQDFYKAARRVGYDNPVLILSASNAERTCRELGADDWMAKPFMPSELVEKVHHLVDGSNGA